MGLLDLRGPGLWRPFGMQPQPAQTPGFLLTRPFGAPPVQGGGQGFAQPQPSQPQLLDPQGGGGNAGSGGGGPPGSAGSSGGFGFGGGQTINGIDVSHGTSIGFDPQGALKGAGTGFLSGMLSASPFAGALLGAIRGGVSMNSVDDTAAMNNGTPTSLGLGLSLGRSVTGDLTPAEAASITGGLDASGNEAGGAASEAGGVGGGGAHGMGPGGGDASDAGDSGDAGDGFSQGGMIKKKSLKGPNPKGPDQGKITAQAGEAVLNKGAVALLGSHHIGLLNRAGMGLLGRR